MDRNKNIYLLLSGLLSRKTIKKKDLMSVISLKLLADVLIKTKIKTCIRKL